MITGYPTVDHLRMRSGSLMWVCFGCQAASPVRSVPVTHLRPGRTPLQRRPQRSPDAAGSITGAILQNCALTTLPPCSVTGASRTTPYGVLLTLSSPGRVHIPSDNLMKTLDPNQLTLQSYHNALKDVDSLIINPADFLPDDEAQDHYEKVFKSQIARVMYKYVARPADSKRKLPMDPPDIELISHEQPKIHMMKLMNESDNSAEGIGQVMEALRRQSRLEPGEFFGRFQLIDGDLGTAQIFNAIRSLRFPSEHCDHSLNNVSFTLGAAHTLWNIAHTILTHHFGNSKAMDDLGVWRYLQALGIPPEKVIQKKDFTKMLQYMEQVHEATLWYCLRHVMGEHDSTITEDLPVIPTSNWNAIVNQCYNQFCSHEARRAAQSSPKLYNLFIRLQDFSTVIEANRSMKRGDIGRLINVWKMWSIMTQSLPGLTHYSAYLPRLILLITKILPPSLSELIRHSILVSPSGRPNHFVAKDFLLETHNYWLKYFYVRGGIGTQIERLQELFSSNIPIIVGPSMSNKVINHCSCYKHSRGSTRWPKKIRFLMEGLGRGHYNP
ncbi:uncharacterized protein PGTG_21692 [Puccinia graminis f. sp. tritici CRL 75-36-700-3]|uniref:DUF6589 domain-containing protein n=1 Tax=Puccinia graminis f. sp. tritici (strain CRL 75-36-700-3 / race SCCL) TaxID=418459 RepID=H6QS43_PUCGT|nr:uncharacterized protein PGTG_21692 [Puccinia graminis f. sp. tritici CRL 75-36-700-3]EHS63516.1 hypothetical protein PGTG_21692 [Puccinia graminis f. sp. tritici CRL 75-36-700-3]